MTWMCTLLALCVALAAQAQTDWQARAREAQRARDFSGAAEAYRKLLEGDPANPQLLTNLGIMLHLAGRNEDALAPLEQAIRARPELIPARLFAGLALLNLGRPREALPHLERARSGDPAGALPLLGLAKAHAVLGDLRQANDEFDAAAARDARNPEIWSGLGATYSALANDQVRRFWTAKADTASIDRALKAAGYPSTRREMLAAERDLAAHPGSLTLQARLIRARLALAVAAYTRAAKLEPESYDHHMRLAESLTAANRPAEADAEYQRAAALRPDSAAAYLGLAIARRLAGAHDQALAPLQKAHELEPANPDINGLLGDLLARRAEFAQARPLLEQALAANPALAPAQAALAKVYLAEGRLDAALEATQKSLAGDVDGSYYYQLSRVLRQMGREEEAAAALAQFRARRALRRSTP